MASRRNFFKTSQRKKWQEGSYRNPYFEGGKPSWKRRLFIMALVLGCMILLGFLVFTPLLRIQTYGIEGIEFIPAGQIEEVAKTHLAGRRFGVFPKDHLLVFSEKELTQMLFETFQLDRLSVERRGRELLVRVTEKISRLVWETSGAAYVVDERGVVLGPLDASMENHQLTTIHSLRNETLSIGESVLDAQTMGSILNLLFLLRKEPLQVTTLEIDSSDARFLRVNMEEGYAVYFDPSAPVDEQLRRLIDVLKGESVDPARYESIDVRFGERVYIKDKK